MGALSSNRKRGDECFSPNHLNPYQNSLSRPVSKKPRISCLHPSPDKPVLSSNSTVSRISRYPEIRPPLNREVHAPCRTLKFGLSSCLSQASKPKPSGFSEGDKSGSSMGNYFSLYDNAKRSAFGALRYFNKDKQVIDVDNEPPREVTSQDLRYFNKDKQVIDVDNELPREVISEDSSIEEVEVIEDGREGSMGEVQVIEDGREGRSGMSASFRELGGKMVEEKNLQPSSSSVLTDSNNGSLKVDATWKMLGLMSPSPGVTKVLSVEAYRKLFWDAEKRNSRLEELNFEIRITEKKRASQVELRALKKPVEKPVEEVPVEPFLPLTEEEEAEVNRAFHANRRAVLATHRNSNIDITAQIFQCLTPGAWLNDEVINLYLELLKEREKREPRKFLKCHFFNTFFYKKLVGGESGYNYGAVRRWTSERKLGYHLVECDKIFVPIHKEIHWCLAVINNKEQKFQYLDSLKGGDTRVLKALRRYFMQEVKDKSGKDIDLSSWKEEIIEDLPEQENGYDCGMFMLKYIDFYSRGLGLYFNQEHMPYFRLRTAKEILRLTAD